jgi:hypothetical protein
MAANGLDVTVGKEVAVGANVGVTTAADGLGATVGKGVAVGREIAVGANVGITTGEAGAVQATSRIETSQNTEILRLDILPPFNLG